MNELELQTRIAKLGIRIEKAASKMPGRKRIPGDGDGDGIPNEGRKPKGGASGGIPAKPKLNNEGQPGKATQDTVLNNLDNAIRSGNVKAVNRGIKHARSAASNFALMGRHANNLTDKEKSALMQTESIWRTIAAHGSAGLRHLKSGGAPQQTSQSKVQTQNEGDGFHGSVLQSLKTKGQGAGGEHSANAGAADAFSRMANKLVDAGHFSSAKQAGQFLDSRMGRHLGDEIGHDGDPTKVKWLRRSVTQFKQHSLEKAVERFGKRRIKSSL